MHFIVIVFLLLAAVFAWTHQIAMAGSFYWYYWWFDIVMHFWGGILLGLGVHAVTSLKSVHIRPVLPVVLAVILSAVIGWEVFERIFGLFNPNQYIVDTTQDVLLGITGGLLAHFVVRMFTMDRV